MQKPIQDTGLGSQWETKFVCFMDILGFSQMVEDAQASSASLRELTASLDGVLHRLMSPSCPGHNLRSFSDCLCLSTPYSEDGLFNMFELLVNIQPEFITRKILLRGCLTVGNHCEAQNFIPSPALIDAYRAESRQARYPRILISAGVVELVHNPSFVSAPTCRAAVEEKVYLDDDGHYFLDYLCWITDGSFREEFIRSFLGTHREVVNFGLISSTNSDVREKYEWMKTHHNRKVRLLGEPWAHFLIR